MAAVRSHKTVPRCWQLWHPPHSQAVGSQNRFPICQLKVHKDNFNSIQRKFWDSRRILSPSSLWGINPRFEVGYQYTGWVHRNSPPAIWGSIKRACIMKAKELNIQEPFIHSPDVYQVFLMCLTFFWKLRIEQWTRDKWKLHESEIIQYLSLLDLFHLA